MDSKNKVKQRKYRENSPEKYHANQIRYHNKKLVERIVEKSIILQRKKMVGILIDGEKKETEQENR